jgi:polysaccharide export outer membrane protein
LPLLAVLVLAACAGSNAGAIKSGQAPAVTSASALPKPDTTTATGAYTGVSDYHIGPLDLLEVTVFQVKDLHREVRVNSTGYISLPLIGAVQAGGKTVPELEADIATKLAENYLQDPQVSVFVKEFTSQRITVEGAVKKPGIFPITGRTSLLQAVALSEGLDPLADESTVVVFRTVSGERMAAVFDLRQIRGGKIEDPQLYGDDLVVVERSGSKTAVRSVTETLRGFIGFGTIRPY